MSDVYEVIHSFCPLLVVDGGWGITLHVVVKTECLNLIVKPFSMHFTYVQWHNAIIPITPLSSWVSVGEEGIIAHMHMCECDCPVFNFSTKHFNFIQSSRL